MHQKAALRSQRKTVARRTKHSSLKLQICAGLKRDKDAQLDRAATEIEEAMAKDMQQGYQLLLRWYKRREGKGLALSPLAMSKVEEEYGKLYSASAPPGHQIPLDRVRRQHFKVSDKVPKDWEIQKACKRMRKGKAAGRSGLSVDTLRGWEADK